jgi:hypothetical protein
LISILLGVILETSQKATTVAKTLQTERVLQNKLTSIALGVILETSQKAAQCIDIV